MSWLLRQSRTAENVFKRLHNGYPVCFPLENGGVGIGSHELSALAVWEDVPEKSVIDMSSVAPSSLLKVGSLWNSPILNVERAYELDRGFKTFSGLNKTNRLVVFRVMKHWEDVDHTVDRLGNDITAFQVVAAFKCLMHMPNVPPHALLKKLGHLATHLTDKMLPEHFPVIIHSCGEMRYWNACMLDAFAERILKCKLYQRLDAIGFVQMIGGLGRLQKVMLEHRHGELVKGNRVWLFRNFYKLFDQLDQYFETTNGVSEFKRNELVRVLEGLAQLSPSLSPKRKLVSNFANATISPSHVGWYTTQQMASIVRSLCDLGMFGKQLPARFTVELVKNDKIGSYTTDELVSMFESFACMDLDSNVHPIHVFYSELMQPYRLPYIKSKQLMSVLACVRHFGFFEQENFNRIVREAFNPARVGGYTPRELIDILDVIWHAGGTDAGLVAQNVLIDFWGQIFGNIKCDRRELLRNRHKVRSDLGKKAICALWYRFSKLGMDQVGQSMYGVSKMEQGLVSPPQTREEILQWRENKGAFEQLNMGGRNKPISGSKDRLKRKLRAQTLETLYKKLKRIRRIEWRFKQGTYNGSFMKRSAWEIEEQIKDILWTKLDGTKKDIPRDKIKIKVMRSFKPKNNFLKKLIKEDFTDDEEILLKSPW